MINHQKKILKYNTIIIGAGPGGMTAALYLKRANKDVILFEKKAPGGILNEIDKIENYPGFIEEKGPKLAFNMFSMLSDLEIPLKKEEIINIEKEKDFYKVITNKNSYECENVIIASGRIPRKLDVENSDKFEGKGISYCVTCDGTLYKNKNVIVIGGGNSAAAACLYLEKIAKKIYLINRTEILRMDKSNQRKLSKMDNLEIIYNSKIESLMIDNDKIIGVKLTTEETINIDGIFVYIGQEQNNAYYQNLKINEDKKGILVNLKMETNIENVYAIGDAISKDLYQVITASADGAIAANEIIRK